MQSLLKSFLGAPHLVCVVNTNDTSLNEYQHQLLETGESAVLESRSLNVVEPKFLLEKSLNKYFNFYKITHVVKGIQERIKLASYINGNISIVTSKFLQVFYDSVIVLYAYFTLLEFVVV